MRRTQRSDRSLTAVLLGGVVVALIGAGLMFWAAVLYYDDPLSHFSYDAPFWFRNLRTFQEPVLVYVDERTIEQFGGEDVPKLDRKAQRLLLERLTAVNAKLVFYDFFFDMTNDPPEVDKEFAESIRTNGRVILAASGSEDVYAPIPVLREAARSWGLGTLRRDSDEAVRRIQQGNRYYPSAVWLAAEALGAGVTTNPANRFKEKWLNYYGRAAALTNAPVFPIVRFEEVLKPDGVVAQSLSNKIVIVHARSGVGAVGAKKDTFRNPYCYGNEAVPAFGAEIHATALTNLLRNDWLEQMPFGWQFGLAIVLGFAAGAALTWVGPWHSLWLAPALILIITLATLWLQWHRNVWWSWLVPAGVEVPVALVWSIGAYGLVESRRRRRLRHALAAYVSPHIADQLVEQRFDLSPGGEVKDVTVLFTDIEGFTGIAEKMAPEKVSELLNAYFTEASKLVMDRGGTISKYIGDAIMAFWGAPLDDARHAESAVLAAWELAQAWKRPIADLQLRTRIGINSGPALAGNLGSDIKMDYTVIGDTVNFASRLEKLNKPLGTELLISEETRKKLGPGIKTRCVGRYRVRGKFHPVTCHEVLGPVSNFPIEPGWVSEFDAAVGSYSKRDFVTAEQKLRQVIHMRGGKDGPSEFYLRRIAEVVKGPRPGESWDDVLNVTMD